MGYSTGLVQMVTPSMSLASAMDQRLGSWYAAQMERNLETLLYILKRGELMKLCGIDRNMYSLDISKRENE